MAKSLGAGLFGGIDVKAKKKNQRLLNSLSIGAQSHDEDRKPNVDPHKILGEFLIRGIKMRELKRAAGQDVSGDAFIQDDMIKKQDAEEFMKEVKRQEEEKKGATMPPKGLGLSQIRSHEP